MTDTYRFKAIEDDIVDLKKWKDKEVDPYIKKGEALMNQLKGAKTLLWIIIVILTYLAGDKVSSHIDFGKMFSSLSSGSHAAISTEVKAKTVDTIKN